MLRPSWNRVHGVRLVLEERRRSAIAARCYIEDQNSPEAAALRGKAKGYLEAIELINQLEHGWRIGRNRRWL